MKVGVFLLLMVSLNLFAEEKAEEKIEYREAFKGEAPKRDYSLEEKLAHYKMDDDYRSGAYLIYDCDKKIYTCVDDVSFNICKDKRTKDKFLSEKAYSCAPLKKYADREACLRANYEVMHEVHFSRFCYPRIGSE